MQAQGGPSRAELWDKGQRGTPDSYLGPKKLLFTPAVSLRSKTKSYPNVI